ncbi:MAG TPA: cytochrome d ubiquinol oxidase subunit II [Planctomycetes bacterium]|nr:cytochrome d ubiquinol oxidase subunit II [Planctomycetota bacterium]
MDLHLLWFLLLGVLLGGYAVLDGFDLGVGILHPFLARTDGERRVFMNAIGPTWDGNEVWLITFGGALFAAFPDAYATLFSGFYLALMAVLFALILRAVSLEFRSKLNPGAWRALWDFLFFLGSFLAAVLLGVAGGNVVMGIPIGRNWEFTGNFLTLLRPFPILTGLLTAALMALHGASFLQMKTAGDLRKRINGAARKIYWGFLVLFLATLVWGYLKAPYLKSNLQAYPWAWAVVGAAVLVLLWHYRCLLKEKPGRAFLGSTILTLGAIFLFAFSLFPNLLISSTDQAWNMNIYNASSSPKTLATMAVIAGVGMPVVLLYTAFVYWVFRGKVQIEETSY